MNLAVIPARGGSKRIPKKNIKLFLAKPIIAYSIEAAQKTGLFDEIIVSTDDPEIASVAEDYGASVPFMRPDELSDDFTGTDAVVDHALRWYHDSGQIVDNVCCIYATAPLIQTGDIIKGYECIKEDGAISSFSVTSFGYPIFRALKIDGKGNLDMIWPEHLSSRSQDLPEAYHDAGQFYWLNVAKKPSEGALFFSGLAKPVVLPSWRVQDIDTLEDWTRAEMLFKLQRENNR